jgi:hypothetical protein
VAAERDAALTELAALQQRNANAFDARRATRTAAAAAVAAPSGGGRSDKRGGGSAASRRVEGVRRSAESAASVGSARSIGSAASAESARSVGSARSAESAGRQGVADDGCGGDAAAQETPLARHGQGEHAISPGFSLRGARQRRLR